MSMQGLAATGQIEVSFVLLWRLEASGVLTHSDDNWYPMFHMLLEACSVVGDFNGTSQVQAVVDQLGFREFTKGYLGSKGAWKIKNLSPWSYPDAAAAGAAAAASAAASAVCILSCTYTGARSAPL